MFASHVEVSSESQQMDTSEDFVFPVRMCEMLAPVFNCIFMQHCFLRLRYDI